MKNNNQIFDEIWKKNPKNIPHQIVINKITKLKNIHDILEIGAGTGVDLIILKDKGYNVTFSDYSQIAVNNFKKSTKAIPAYQVDARNIKFKDNSFDLVYSLGLLEFFNQKDQQRIISEMIRVSKQYVLIDVPQRYSIYTLIKKVLLKLNKWPFGQETEFSYYEIKNMLSKFNVTIIDSYGRDIIPIPRMYKKHFPYIDLKIFSKFIASSFGIIIKKNK